MITQLYSLSSNSNMPIYSFISNLIQVDAESKRIVYPSHSMQSFPGQSQTPSKNPSSIISNSPNRFGNNRNYKVDHASASEVPEQVYDSFSRKPFEKEITRANNIHIKFNNKLKELIQKPYLALKTAFQICPNCFPEDKSLNVSSCIPRCYGMQCQRCLLYGHVTNLCLQSHDKDSNPILKSK